MSLLRHASTRSFSQLHVHPLLRPGAAIPLRHHSSPLQLPSRRRFHIGASFNNATTVVAEAISSVHHVGVPWYLTIPLLAVSVNLAFRLPLHYYNRRRIVKMRELAPLITAWAARARSSSGSSRSVSDSRWTFLKSSNRIFKNFGVQRWKGWLAWLAPMAPFIIASVSLRRLAGVSSITSQGAKSLVSGDVSSVPLDVAFDPSLAQGGMLWFTDLTAADPYYLLPILSSMAIGTNLWLNMPADRLRALLTLESGPGAAVPDSRIGRALGRLSLGMPLLPLIMSHLPSALMLYWVTNFSLTVLNDIIVRRLVPEKPSRVELKQNDDLTKRVLPYLPAAYPADAEASDKVGITPELTKKS